MSYMFLEDYSLSTFNREEVKGYVRKGKFVKRYDRKGEDKKPLANKLAVGAGIGAAGLLGVGALAGGGAVANAAFKAKFDRNTTEAAARIIKDRRNLDDLKIMVAENGKFTTMRASDLKGKDNVIYAVGGFGAREGRHSDLLAERLKKDYPDSVVVAIRNTEYDIPFTPQLKRSKTEVIMETARRIPSTLNLMVSTAWKGNKTGEELAKTMYALENLNPGMKHSVVAASGGGMASLEGMTVAKKLGIGTDKMNGTFLGSPTFGLAPKDLDVKSYVDKKDGVVGFLPVEKNHLVAVDRGDKPYTNKAGLTVPHSVQHDLNSYLDHPEVKKMIDGRVKGKGKDK